jgi:hypothetical protein
LSILSHISLALGFGLAALSDIGGRPATVDAALRCSLAPYVGVRLDSTFLVGVALPDTLRAGRGSVAVSTEGGHWGSGRPREVYGQLVHFEMVNADAPEALRSLPPERRKIILVPWDYDAGCKPTYWTRSAAWVEAGREGFYTVRLRPIHDWVNGIPVADAFTADRNPYRPRKELRGAYAGGVITPSEYFSLYSVLPTLSEFDEQLSVVRKRLSAWELANPAAAKRSPADRILAEIREELKSLH